MGKVVPVPTMLVARSLITAPPGNVLLVRRSPGKRNAGFWEAPGGKAEQGEVPDIARAREIIDEVSLRIRAVSKLNFVSARIITELPYNVVYMAIFNVSVVVSGTARLSGEHDNLAWVPYEQATDYALTSETAAALEALASLLPQW